MALIYRAQQLGLERKKEDIHRFIHGDPMGGATSGDYRGIVEKSNYPHITGVLSPEQQALVLLGRPICTICGRSWVAGSNAPKTHMRRAHIKEYIESLPDAEIRQILHNIDNDRQLPVTPAENKGDYTELRKACIIEISMRTEELIPIWAFM